jgi:Cu-Zn family superoxide dismutase
MKSIKLSAAALCLAVAMITLAWSGERGSGVSTRRVAVGEEGVAVLSPTRGYHVEGTLMLRQEGGMLHVTGEVTGLEPGEHGFHIHEFGDLRDPEGKAAGGHFNPTGERHGSPDSPHHHEGDLGNITADARGVAHVDKEAKGVELQSVLGRSFVVHAGVDDFVSQPSGDAGPRAAVGVIGIANPDYMHVSTASR